MEFWGAVITTAMFSNGPHLYAKLNSVRCGGLLDQNYYHIIGDSGFQLEPCSLIPYRGVRGQNLESNRRTAVWKFKKLISSAVYSGFS